MTFLAHRMAEMEKRRVGTRFMDYEVDKNDFNQPIFAGLYMTITDYIEKLLRSLKLIN